MFKTLREAIASILTGRGLSIENKQGRQGGFTGLFDAEIGANQHWASDGLRRAILGEGPKRGAPTTTAEAMQCPMREIGRRPSAGGIESNRQYLQDGGLDHDNH